MTDGGGKGFDRHGSRAAVRRRCRPCGLIPPLRMPRIRKRLPPTISAEWVVREFMRGRSFASLDRSLRRMRRREQIKAAAMLVRMVKRQHRTGGGM